MKTNKYDENEFKYIAYLLSPNIFPGTHLRGIHNLEWARILVSIVGCAKLSW